MKRIVTWMLNAAKWEKNAPPFENRGYRWIHELKEKLGKNIPDLIAMARQRDPFFCGSDLDWERGRWFAAIWKQLGYENATGIHLRRVHYRLVDSSPKKLNGKPYENTEADWAELLACSRAARLLNLVNPSAFDDHRSPDPYLAAWRAAELYEPCAVPRESQIFWALPSIGLDFDEWRLRIGTPGVLGYEPDDYKDRGYYLELWIEKSTMDDILVPLCRRFGVTLQPSVGFQSISNPVKLLQRIRQKNKPTRVFYISDFDNAGDDMPVAVSRQIEFWLPEYAPGAEVKVQHLALTREQVDRYRLPRDDKGRVELDALEARRPGELAKLVREAVAPYVDDTIESRLEEARDEATELVTEEWSDLMRPHERKLAAIRKKVEGVVLRYRQEVDGLNQRMQDDMADLKKSLERLGTQVKQASEAFDPELPDRPEPAEVEQDESDWLFDSTREYFEQLGFYKAHQGKADQ